MVNREAIFKAIDNAVIDLKSVLTKEDVAKVDSFGLYFYNDGDGSIHVTMKSIEDEYSGVNDVRDECFTKKYSRVF